MLVPWLSWRRIRSVLGVARLQRQIRRSEGCEHGNARRTRKSDLVSADHESRL